MKNKIYLILFILLILSSGIYFFVKYKYNYKSINFQSDEQTKNVETENEQAVEYIEENPKEETSSDEVFSVEAIKTLNFSDDFSKKGSFTGGIGMNESNIPNWWLNSGGYFYIESGVGKTIQGELSKDDKQRLKYRGYNASETDDGFHPQNIFRLVLRSKWKNFTQECYYKINKYILSADSHRTVSNGILLFNRYQDGNNLYYTGIRVDGFVVIKKKIKGKYYMMAYNRIIDGKYDRDKNPNLLTKDKWIGLKSEVQNEMDGSVSIKVYWDKEKSGNWELIAEATDNGKKYGGKAFLDEGYAGIRTDFMDVEFDDYKIEED